MKPGDRYIFDPEPAGERVYAFVDRVVGKHRARMVCRTARGESWVHSQHLPLPLSFRQFDWTIEDVERERAS